MLIVVHGGEKPTTDELFQLLGNPLDLNDQPRGIIDRRSPLIGKGAVRLRAQ